MELKTGVAATDALNKVDKSLKLVFLWPPRGRGITLTKSRLTRNQEVIARVETEEATTTNVDVKSSKVEIERTVESSSKFVS